MRCCWPRREDRSTPRAGRAGQPHRSDRPRLGAGSGRIGRLVESGSSDGHGACELTSAAQDMINTKICGAAPGGGGNGSVAGGVRRRGGESALGGAARSAASSVRAGAYENAYVRSLIRQHTPTRHTRTLTRRERGSVRGSDFKSCGRSPRRVPELYTGAWSTGPPFRGRVRAFRPHTEGREASAAPQTTRRGCMRRVARA